MAEQLRVRGTTVNLTSVASPILGCILYVIAVFLLPVEVIYAQDELNKVWRAAGSRN